MDVPTATSLRDIYADDVLEAQKSRWETLLAEFQKEYGRPADFVSRSPGRVNIIGEHVDYSLYEVLPMAITGDVLIAVAVIPDRLTIRLASTRPDKFPSKQLDIPADGIIEIDSSTLEWTNYFKAGLHGVSELLSKKRGSLSSGAGAAKSKGRFRSVGMDVLVDGSVPPGGGLSSSAALMCASALAILKANGEEKVDKKELTELAIVSERSVGVNSGGMDQAASVFAQTGSALYISFKPLSAKALHFPETDELNILVAQSFVAADKHDTAQVGYNLRVVECTLAAVVLAKIFSLKKALPSDDSPLGVSLRGFHDTFFEEKSGVKDNSQTSAEDFIAQLKQLIQMTEDYLPQEEGYTLAQIAQILGMTPDELHARFTTKYPVKADHLLLRQRALHVFSEAIRVNQFMRLLADHSAASAPPGEQETDALLRELGSLMNLTQDSCRDDYACSCTELDELCQLARSAGSYGSRLTGAGWGGCTVHLVPKGKVEKVKQAWREKYYKQRWPEMSDKQLEEAIVVSRPGSGSAVFVVTGPTVV